MKKYTLVAIVAAILAAQGVMAQPPEGKMAPPHKSRKDQPTMDCKMKCGPAQGGGASGMRSGMPMLMRISRDEELQKQAGITSEESEKIKLMATEVQKKMIDLRAALEKAQLDLQSAMNMPEPSREAVMASADALAAAESAMMKANIGVKFDLIGLLGADKVDAIQKACSERRMDLRKKEGRDERTFRKGKKGRNKDDAGKCPRDDDEDDGDKEDQDND